MTRWSPAMARWTVGTGALALAVALTMALAPSPARAQGAAPSVRVAFTRAQAEAGSLVYAKSCASCHGSMLDDGVATPLGYSYYEPDIAQAAMRATWSDAEWTFDRFAYRLGRGEGGARR